ncbi:putative cysteine-rich receptor-like protein kinase 20 [Phragmites australis]|uniref:putative cysteine-rich receptor-like protein kinase 20 n=1 Tax=Phragmites australis TaxID=29695 RepID=UPI002D78CD2C|nr:putative cysteine-rich receptor-like protein kinase 20 [Phragmites australis]
MASPLDSSSGMWAALGQASNVAQLVGVDALGLVSMVVQAALAARRHRDACRRLAQHVELVGGLLRELELAELMRREATRRPLEQLRCALRRCYALVTACQDCGYLRSLLVGARMADELRAAEQEIDMFIRLVPLIALVDTTHDRRAKSAEGVPSVVASYSNLHTRIPRRAAELTEINAQGAVVPCKVGGQLLEGTLELQEQKIMDVEELVKLCTRTEASCPGFKKFDFFQIVDGTDNFSGKRIVGRGGFGTVYKAQLTNGIMVAIKRLDEHATVFDSELQLASLQHINLIRLLGWCVNGKERILVYEFMDNGSLDRIIFEKTKGALLNWHKRLQIIKGLADGLVYMHKHSRSCIIHGDLKSENILLDRDMNPKIADFGSARALSSDIAEGRTIRIVGTSGYIAPEYASRGLYSVKIDVFGFGVLALVIISGRRNTILEQKGDTVGNLVRDAWQLWNDGRLHDLIDPLLSDGYEIAKIVRCAQVALLCAQEDPADRPTMSDVVALLNFESTSLLPDPKPPSALINRGATDDKLSTYISQSSRTIDITITSSAPVSTRIRIIVDPDT